jgi:hypothetical protein
MNAPLQRRFTRSRSARWSMYAGLYMFVCAAATAVLLSDIVALLGNVIGFPAPFSMVVLAVPAFFTGAAVWWLLVERTGSYSYPLGGACGLLTALLTGLVWTGQFVRVWGVEMLGVPAVSVLVAFVFGVVVVAGALSALPLMYARRRTTRRAA